MFQHRAATVRILAHSQNTIYPCFIVTQRTGERKGHFMKQAETAARNAVIYARYSSHNQTEQSIEGQLRVCHEYAQREGFTIVGEYIDRAISGKTDDRPDFQRMISDSRKRAFQILQFGACPKDKTRYAEKRPERAVLRRRYPFRLQERGRAACH